MTLRSVAAAGLRRLPTQARLRLLHGLGRFAPWETGFDFTPPTLSPGEAGAAGLRGHRGAEGGDELVVLAHRVPPGCLNSPGHPQRAALLSRFGTASFGPAEIEAYHGWFPRRPGTLAGEWTPITWTTPGSPAPGAGRPQAASS